MLLWKIKEEYFPISCDCRKPFLLMTNVSQEGLLPPHHAVIIDEAHNLVKAAYDQFKIEWSEQNVSYQLQSIDPSHPRSNRWNNILNHLSDSKPDIREAREELKDSVKGFFTKSQRFYVGVS